MRVGFFFWPYTPEYTERMARLGEAHGFDMVGIADTPGNAMDPWVAMTLAAAVTSRVRLATCVTNLVTRHPSITASAAASVDAVSEGRSVLGIGAGHSGVANVGGVPAGPSSRGVVQDTQASPAGRSPASAPRPSGAGGAAFSSGPRRTVR